MYLDPINFTRLLEPFQQTRWHVLGQCQHPDLKDASRKAALKLQYKTHSTFTQTIKDPRGRLPYLRQLIAITADDQWVCQTMSLA